MARRVFGWNERLFNGFVVLDTYLGRRRVNRLLAGLRRYNQRALLKRARKVANPLGRIPERIDLTPEAFREAFLRPLRPVVLRGAAKGFPAISKWSPEFFRDHYGDMPVLTFDGSQHGVEDEEAGIGAFETAQMTLAEQVDGMLAGRFDYVSFWTELFTEHPELTHDLDVALLRSHVSPSRLASEPIFKMFMGAAGTATSWHCAELQNLFIQVHGTKDWWLCSPEWTPAFDARVATLEQQYVHSMIDFRAPDHERYPLYRHAPIQHVVLEPGDVLYIPPFWWHCVENPETSIGLATWWLNVVPALRSHPTLCWLTVLSPQHLVSMVREYVRGGDTASRVDPSTIFGAHQS